MKKPLTDEQFRDALFNDDELGSVIRVHLHVEFHINEIINSLVPYPEDLKSLSLDYDGKLNLICALGVKNENKKTFSVLGKMRNKFAHNPEYSLTKSEVKNLYESLSKENKGILQECHNEARKLPENHKIGAYRSLNPRDQFKLIAVVIRMLVISIRDEINQRNV